jgi:acyl-coenzyme A synthetase/AMP-(fatty) acid ligase
MVAGARRHRLLSRRAPRQEICRPVRCVPEPELRRHVADRLPYMVPQRIHLVPALPRTSSGKIDRPRLLALFDGDREEA